MLFSLLSARVQSFKTSLANRAHQEVNSLSALHRSTLIFIVGKLREAFALQNFSCFFSTKNIGVHCISDINV